MPDHLELHGCRHDILGHYLKATGPGEVGRGVPAEPVPLSPTPRFAKKLQG